MLKEKSQEDFDQVVQLCETLDVLPMENFQDSLEQKCKELFYENFALHNYDKNFKEEE